MDSLGSGFDRYGGRWGGFPNNTHNLGKDAGRKNSEHGPKVSLCGMEWWMELCRRSSSLVWYGGPVRPSATWPCSQPIFPSMRVSRLPERRHFPTGGSAQIEDEVVFPRQAQRMYKPKYAVLMTPLCADMSDCTCDCVQLVDSTLFGDILWSVWKVGAFGISMIRISDGHNFAQVSKTVGGRYNECGLLAAGDERGVVNHHAIRFSRG